MRLTILLGIAFALCCSSGCGLFDADRSYNKNDPGSIQRDDYLQKKPRDAFLYGNPIP
jgi:hypothetical protein